MPRHGYKKSTSPPKSIKRKKPVRNKRKRNGVENAAAVETIYRRFKKGYSR